ncbi:hypothetical protein ACFQRL_00400 [Microbacterium fluvii]|uniref:Uncharacterized protein n=1 Tax=Microbacterium fluvii TaxID=415215 RepID=A0ABW2HC47_9MICO|nr:hypothetical protein [Microbacterium fluvii]MCU4671045.1 hypothetical protein [Microbacterium fluvii]
MTSDTPNTDAALFRALRRTWETVDPVPADLVDRMIASVATADLTREYALLALVESASESAVRGDADMLTLQFSDGKTSVLVHVTPTESGGRRLDGWVDGSAAEIELIQDGGSQTTAPESGRFAFDEVPVGVARLRVVLAAEQDAELTTPRFEL